MPSAVKAGMLRGLRNLALGCAWLGAHASEPLCGWLDNPTPGNWSLIDARGEWEIATQGSEHLDPASWDKLPVLPENERVNVNGHYGYGCACLDVTLDTRKRWVLRIHSGKPRLLKHCLEDPKLPKAIVK